MSTSSSTSSNSKAVIAIHGGAGTILRSAMNSAQEKAYHDALSEILNAGQAILAAGGSALDAVAKAVSMLEDCPLFNAGKGAVYTHAGTHELDAAIMDGATLGAGAVANVAHVRNPILAARAVMEHSEHILLVGAGAEEFVAQHGAELVEPEYFHTEARHAQWLRARKQEGMLLLDHDAASQAATEIAPIDPDNKFGTVGAVALDLHGNLAAATSTGGITNKRVGRVGDSPLIGAGCYANNRSAAISATGTGEAFMRTVAAYDISARMEYAGQSLQDAAQHVVMDLLPRYQGRGGLIAIDAEGNMALPFNTEGMYRGYARVGAPVVTAIYK
ncbi:isoaspartyl peptidase/L-asparaginase family protein [Collimonas pratensis]|uniref:Asparaginase family protein n=1 Tax=Collimonas pratensis TaxID=279113 RepID=A0ABN4M5X1_9BURK|nr:isoaspartyl peptidase/L-asparaginase [Collimonas pratensis]AMP12911.1 asparaginase family protein [Collimonas pratensis]